MEHKGIPAKLVRLVRIIAGNTKAKVIVDGRVGDEIPIKRGVWQGTLSALLFNVALYAICEKLEGSSNTVYKTTQTLAYADDIILMA